MSLIWDLISRRAFVPDPLNEECPLHERFTRRPLMGISLCRESLDVCTVTFAKEVPVISNQEHFEFVGEDYEAAFLNGYAERHRARECVVSVDYGFKVSTTTRAHPAPAGQLEVQIMRREPERMTGETPDTGLRPALAFHPTHGSAFLFTIPEIELTKVAALLAKANLSVARMHLGICSLMRGLMEAHWALVGRSAQVLVVSPTVVFHAHLHEKKLDEPGYAALRTAEVREEIVDRLAKLQPSSRVILVNTSSYDVAALIRERGCDNEIVEPLQGLSQPLLQACCLH